MTRAATDALETDGHQAGLEPAQQDPIAIAPEMAAAAEPAAMATHSVDVWLAVSRWREP